MQKRIAKVLSVTTSITTTLWVSGAASFAPVNAAVTINEGDIFRASNDYKVYIAKYVGAKKFKRWFVGPQMFDIYKHLGFAKVKVVDPAVAAGFTESKLVRVDGDDKVWHIGNAVAGQSAEKQWIPTLAVFQGAGFDWDGVYLINAAEGAWYAMGANYGGATGPTPTTTPMGGTIGASLAVDNPAGSVLADGSVYNSMLKVTLVGGPATVTGLTVTKYGLLANAEVNGVSVWDQTGKRHGAVVTSFSSDNKATIGFGSDPIVMNGAAQTITIKANIKSTAQSGTVYLGVASASDIASNGTIGGAFPLMGNLFTITDGASSLGNVTITGEAVAGTSAEGASQNADIGDEQKEIGRFRFTQTNGLEDIQVEGLTFYVAGTITESKDVLNWKLYDAANNVLATAEKPVDRYVTFMLGTPYKIEKGLNRVLTVKADVKDGSGKTFRTGIQNDYDVMIRGVSTGAYMSPASFSSEVMPTNPWFKVSSGELTITVAPGSPSGNIAQGATDQPLAKFILRSKGEDMEVRKLDLYITRAGAQTALTGNVSIRDEAGTVTHATMAASDSEVYNNTTVGTRYDLSTYIQLKSNVDKVITVYGNVSSSAANTDKYTVYVGNLYAKRLSTIDYQDYLSTIGTYQGAYQLSVISGSLTVSKNSAFGDTTIAPSSNDVKIGSFVVQGGQAEDATLTALQISVTSGDSTAVRNVKVKVNNVQQGSTVATLSSANTFSVNIVVPKSTPVIVDIFGDAASDSSGKTLQLALSQRTMTVTGRATSNTIDAPVPGIVLQAMSFAKGTLTITRDSSSQTEQILTPVNGALLGSWKLEARNEKLTLSKITFAAKTADGSTNVGAATGDSNFGTLSLKEGSNPLGPGAVMVGTDVTFTGFNLEIPAAGSKVISLYADLTGSGVQDPGSVVRWVVKSDDTSQDMTLQGAAGVVQPTEINGNWSETAFATSTRFLYHNSKPVIALSGSSPTTGKSPSTNDTLFIFTVTNSGVRDMRIGSLTATVSQSGMNAAGTVSAFELFDGTTKIATNNRLIGGSTSTPVAIGFTAREAIGTLMENLTITAGGQKTFTIKADTSDIRDGLNSSDYARLTVKIDGQTGYGTSSWNSGDVQFFYTPVTPSTEVGPFYVSDSYPVSSATLAY